MRFPTHPLLGHLPPRSRCPGFSCPTPNAFVPTGRPASGGGDGPQCGGGGHAPRPWDRAGPRPPLRCRVSRPPCFTPKIQVGATALIFSKYTNETVQQVSLIAVFTPPARPLPPLSRAGGGLGAPDGEGPPVRGPLLVPCPHPPPLLPAPRGRRRPPSRHHRLPRVQAGGGVNGMGCSTGIHGLTSSHPLSATFCYGPQSEQRVTPGQRHSPSRVAAPCARGTTTTSGPSASASL